MLNRIKSSVILSKAKDLVTKESSHPEALAEGSSRKERQQDSSGQALRMIVVVLLLFAADRLTKLFLPVQKFYNEGAAFGILQGQTFILSLFSALVLVSLILYTIRKKDNLNTPQKLGIAMIMGGTAGNLFDRVFYGYVIDFIDLKFIDFPVFNLADVFINLGAGILLITLLARK